MDFQEPEFSFADGISVEDKLGQSLFLRSDNTDEEISSKLLNKYIDSINSETDIFSSHITMLDSLGITTRSTT